MRTIGKYTIIFFIAFVISIFSFLIGSPYLTGFFADNAPLLGGALFTIFTSTTPILLSQIKIITEKHNCSFYLTITSIKHSIIELILLLFVVFIMSIVIKSNSINDFAQGSCLDNYGFIKILLSSIQVGAIIGMIEVVRDLLSALIMCMEYK